MTKWKAFRYKYPETQEEWEKEFEWYKLTPEYKEANYYMNVNDFKSIFNVEYYHRFLGNCIAYSVAIPMTYFWS